MNNYLETRRTPRDAEPLAVLATDLLVHAMPQSWKGSSFTVRSMLKAELARLYGWGKDTLRRRLRSAGLDFGRRKLLLPREVEAAVRALGPPTYEITL